MATDEGEGNHVETGEREETMSKETLQRFVEKVFEEKVLVIRRAEDASNFSIIGTKREGWDIKMNKQDAEKLFLLLYDGLPGVTFDELDRLFNLKGSEREYSLTSLRRKYRKVKGRL